jgi:hypothetical protein
MTLNTFILKGNSPLGQAWETRPVDGGQQTVPSHPDRLRGMDTGLCCVILQSNGAQRRPMEQKGKMNENSGQW